MDETVIWRNISIGAPDAEADTDLLDACFVDTGTLESIQSTESHASIVLGRTGQGKSAVLLRLMAVEKNSVQIRPLELAFRFVENSTVIRFFEDAGVNLNLFYRLLWRHVLVTELIRKKFVIRDQNALDRWLTAISSKFKRDTAKSAAIEYLRRWGQSFWQETEVRLVEITEKIESELTASLEGSALAAKMRGAAGEKLSETERAEVVSRGASVVNKIQIADLNRVMQILAEEAFKDEQNKHFIVIDSLDEDWVSSAAKLRLIRALIEEVRTFRSELRNAKVVVALRQDLIERVFDETRDGGFQEEKYESYYARLKWDRDDLESVVRMRINEIFRRKYTSKKLSIEDIFPRARGGDSPMDYMLERTLHRPRDIIAFTNECLRIAEKRPRISWAAIGDAEATYSRKRRNALVDEWLSSLPSINISLELLQGVNETFTRSSITDERLEPVVTQLATSDKEDETIRLCRKAFEPKSSVTMAQLLSSIIRSLYHVGAIGIKYSPESPFLWSFRDDPDISMGDAKRVVSIKVHKMLWKALDIRTGSAFKRK